jgi:hypothetical protein
VSGIMIRRSVWTQHYVVVPNAIARNTQLSFRARGLLVMLLSLPPEWHVTADMLAEDNPDSRTAVRAAMQELREAVYVVLVTERGKDGRTRRHLEVFDKPQPKRALPALGVTSGNTMSSQVAPTAVIPAVGKPAVGKPAVGKPADKRSTGLKDGVEVKKESSLSRARTALAAAGADEREIDLIIDEIKNNRRPRSVAAYLTKVIANGDADDLITGARISLASRMRTEACRLDEDAEDLEGQDGAFRQTEACRAADHRRCIFSWCTCTCHSRLTAAERQATLYAGRTVQDDVDAAERRQP